jgi:NAD(P)-dependent dehydrogenase (short-subunit alcohol dehydrogenase family)
MRLFGQVCVVTGAASGIGRAIAERFLSEGARVAFFDLDPTTLAETIGEVRSEQNDVISAIGSVDDASAVSDTINAVLARWSRIDTLVTAAGVSFGGIATDTTEENWDRVFSVNVKGTFLWCKAVLPSLVARKSGSIITVASQLALTGGRGNAAYVASKGAVISLTRSLALDYAAHGVRVNALVPAAIETPLLRRSFARQADPAAAEKRSAARHALGRFGQPSEVAAAAAFLASNESSFTTGALLPVDGGWLVS